ncbi:MAG: hypothetical protein GTO14_14290 [Anaerolineales bacterium]|nr:hypothetical protein [Anaerolineales bacterium]
MCPHGGQLNLMTSNSKVFAEGTPVLLELDIHTVAGCPFTLPGPKPSPCVRVEWTLGSPKASVNGTPVLTQNSIGMCYSPESALQGVAVIVNTQIKVSAQ